MYKKLLLYLPVHGVCFNIVSLVRPVTYSALKTNWSRQENETAATSYTHNSTDYSTTTT